MENELKDVMADEIQEYIEPHERIAASAGGIIPSGGMDASSIRHLLDNLKADGDLTGSGRVFLDYEVFSDGSGACVNVKYDIGTYYISPSGRTARFDR